MKIHPRTRQVNKGKNELMLALINIINDNDLNAFEIVTILTEMAAWWARQTMHEFRKDEDPNDTDNTPEHLEESKS